MKHLFTLLLSILPLFIFAQKTEYKGIKNFPVDSSGKVMYTGIVQAAGVSQDELYSRAREWFARSFVDSKDALQVDDKAGGKIIGKGVLKHQAGYDFNYGFVVTIQVKDGRYRYSFEDIMQRSQALNNGLPKTTNISLENEVAGTKKINYKWGDNHYQKLNSEFAALETSLKAAMQKGKATDW